jgi:hypothetical protein
MDAVVAVRQLGTIQSLQGQPGYLIVVDKSLYQQQPAPAPAGQLLVGGITGHVTPNQMSDYEQDWRSYRWLRNFWALSSVIFIALAVLTSFLLRFNIGIPDLPGYCIAFLVMWAVLYVLTLIRLVTWPCPRCKKWYFMTARPTGGRPTVPGSAGLQPRWWQELLYAERCAHCGLPKYSR